MTRQAREQTKRKALRDYKRGDKLREIAVRYGTSTTAVSLWAKEAKLPRRERGCRPKIWPDEEDINITNAVRAVVNGKPTLEEIGKQFGNRSRAGIHRIYTRWKNWKPRAPYRTGDIIRLRNRDYEVITARVFDGDVRDLETGEIFVKMPWKYKAKLGQTDQAVKL